MQVDATQTTCTKMSPEVLKDYVVNVTKPDKECCEESEIIACKYEGQVYQVDEVWIASDNPCKNFKCSKLDNTRLAKVEYMTTCNTTCPLGFTYKPEDSSSDKCCGSCQQTSCIIEGEIKSIGETWASKDYCTKFNCTNTDGSVS